MSTIGTPISTIMISMLVRSKNSVTCQNRRKCLGWNSQSRLPQQFQLQKTKAGVNRVSEIFTQPGWLRCLERDYRSQTLSKKKPPKIITSMNQATNLMPSQYYLADELESATTPSLQSLSNGLVTSLLKASKNTASVTPVTMRFSLDLPIPHVIPILPNLAEDCGRRSATTLSTVLALVRRFDNEQSVKSQQEYSCGEFGNDDKPNLQLTFLPFQHSTQQKIAMSKQTIDTVPVLVLRRVW